MRVSVWLLLFQQTFCAGMILWAMALRMRTRPSALHLMLTAIGGGIACTLSLMFPGITARIAGMAAALLLPISALRPLPVPVALRGVLPAIALTVILTGLIGAAAPGISMPLLPLLAVCLPALPLLDRRTPAPRTGMLSITRAGQAIRLQALIDSGNLLRDPLTGLPVIVCDGARIAHLLPCAEDALPVRTIQAHTAAGRIAMPVFDADHVMLTVGNRRLHIRAMIAAAPEGFGGFSALVPASAAENSHVTTQGGSVPW